MWVKTFKIFAMFTFEQKKLKKLFFDFWMFN